MSSWPERCRPPARCAARSPRAARSRAPIAPARSDGEPDERRVGRRVVHDLEHAAQVDDGRLGQQGRGARRAGWGCRGDAGPRRRRRDRAPVAASTAMSRHATGRPRPRAACVASISLDHPVDLLRVRLEQRAGRPRPCPLPFAPGRQRLDARRAPCAGAPRCGWRPRGCSRPERRFCDSAKRAAGGRASAAGSAPGSSRCCRRWRRASRRSPGTGRRPPSPGGPSPKIRCSSIRWAIEVSWYSSSSTTRYRDAQVVDDVGEPLDDLAGEPDLVGEVEHVALGLLRPPLLDEVGQQRALGRRRLACRRRCSAAARRTAACATRSSSKSRSSAGVDAELGELVVEAEQVAW